MTCIDAKQMTLEALEGYDDMMVECVIKVEKFSSIAVAVWADVLRELENRGRVRLLNGSYDDIGNAHIMRLR